MPRQPLREISGNSNYRDGIEGRFELTSYWRSHILGRYVGGQSQKAISEDLDIPRSTIRNTITRSESRYENESLHQSGRPEIVSESLHHHLLREVRANPKIRYNQLRLNLELHEKAVSKATIYRILKKESITN